MLVEIKGDGYHFSGNADCNNKMGVILDVNNVSSYDKIQTEIVLAVDSEGNVIMPAYKNKSLGFVPLLKDYKTLDDLKTFYRSNRSLYGVLGSFVMIVHGYVTYDKETGELIEDKLSFYMPKGITTTSVICDKADTVKGLNSIVVNANILQAYREKVLNSLNKEIVTNKLNYLTSLVKES